MLRQRGKSILRVNALADALCGYDWPGNVRQLENTIERAVALETGRRTPRGTASRASKARAAAAGVGATSFHRTGLRSCPMASTWRNTLPTSSAAVAGGAGAIGWCADPGGRSPGDFVSFVSAPDEEVRTLAVSCSAIRLSSFQPNHCRHLNFEGLLTLTADS